MSLSGESGGVQSSRMVFSLSGSVWVSRAASIRASGVMVVCDGWGGWFGLR